MTRNEAETIFTLFIYVTALRHNWRLRIAAMMERLTTEQRRALALLTSAGRDGMTQSLLTTLGFDASVIAGLVNEGLATQTLSRGRADGNTDFVRIRIKAAGRRAIKG